MSAPSPQVLQYRPLETATTFRLIHYTPKSDTTDTLSLDLVHVTHADVPSVIGKYLAVSYAWGDPTPVQTFSINGALCHLPQSSFEVLQSICKSPSQAYWWIDAVCINQADLAEKAIQIPLMKQIYANALRVVIWIGPPTQDDTSTLCFLEDALQTFEVTELSGKGDQDLEWFLAKTSTKIDSPQWQLVANLFCKPIFRRFWCIQEVLLTKRHMAYNGTTTCRWNGLTFGRKALSSGIHRYLRLRGCLKGSVAPHFESLNILRSHYLERPGDYMFKSFTYVWNESLSYQATNLVDYVYGILGLISSEPGDRPALVPDYQKSDVQIFTEAISVCLRRDLNYDVLSLAGIGFVNESKSVGQLPSWIPNFALTPLPRLLTFESRYSNCAGLSSLENVDVKPDFRFEDGCLIVKGFIVDTVREFIVDTFSDKTTLNDKENGLYTWTRRALAAVFDSALFDIYIPGSWKKWA